MNIVVHNDIVWAYKKASGWFLYIKAFPEAIKRIKGKTKKEDKFLPDVEHPSVLKYVKENL